MEKCCGEKLTEAEVVLDLDEALVQEHNEQVGGELC